jgi:hypothetical protein
LPISPVTDVLKASYADVKTVKTRSVCQLILELPIEALTDVVGLLGAPAPGNEVWVAVARLVTNAQLERGLDALIEPPVIEPPIRRSKSLAQIAGILCATGSFQKFAGASNEQEAADYIRGHCGVASRAEIDSSENATRIFKDIKADYDFWMAGGEVAA